MIMEKGMSSVEVLPSKSSQVTAVKVMVKEHETKSIQKGKPVGFVLVHAGAGYHSESKAKEYKHVCKRACQKAIEKLQAGALATDAVTAALIELEICWTQVIECFKDNDQDLELDLIFYGKPVFRVEDMCDVSVVVCVPEGKSFRILD